MGLTIEEPSDGQFFSTNKKTNKIVSHCSVISPN